MKMYTATLPILFAALLPRVAADFNIFQIDNNLTFHACPNDATASENCECIAANNYGATIDVTPPMILRDGAVWTINGLCGQPALDAYTVWIGDSNIEADIYVHDANPANKVATCDVWLVKQSCGTGAAQVSLYTAYVCQGIC
jgi:hypothetical protein